MNALVLLKSFEVMKQLPAVPLIEEEVDVVETSSKRARLGDVSAPDQET